MFRLERANSRSESADFRLERADSESGMARLGTRGPQGGRRFLYV